MKIDLKDSFKNKNFRYGSYAVITTFIFVAILIAINLFVGQLDFKLDLTQDKMYSISEDSYTVIDKLNQDINIYTLFETGKEDTAVKEMTGQYAKRSSFINVSNKDPYLLPQFTQKYTAGDTEIIPGSIIVESGELFKVLSPYELYSYSYDYYGNPSLQSIDIEPKITNAINYVTGASTCNIYYTQGHDESALPSIISNMVSDENMEYNPVNLMVEDMPEDIDILVVISPQKDFTAEETAKIKTFLENSGRAVIVDNVSLEQRPNFNSILESYGVKLNNSFIVENDSQHLITPNNKFAILPDVQSHEITDPLIAKRYPILLLYAQGIEQLSVSKNTIQVTPLLTTSFNSYMKSNIESTVVEKEPGDIDGPFDVAVAVTDSDTNGAQLVVIGTSYFLEDSVNQTVAGANGDLFLNSLNWLLGSTDKITIRPKGISQEYLQINELQILLIALVTVIIVPAVIIITGIVIWLRRKHK